MSLGATERFELSILKPYFKTNPYLEFDWGTLLEYVLIAFSTKAYGTPYTTVHCNFSLLLKGEQHKRLDEQANTIFQWILNDLFISLWGWNRYIITHRYYNLLTFGNLNIFSFPTFNYEVLDLRATYISILTYRFVFCQLLFKIFCGGV